MVDKEHGNKLVDLVRCNALGEKQFAVLAQAEADSKVYDPCFRSQFELKKEKWQAGNAPLSTTKQDVHYGPIRKKTLKKKVSGYEIFDSRTFMLLILVQVILCFHAFCSVEKFLQ